METYSNTDTEYLIHQELPNSYKEVLSLSYNRKPHGRLIFKYNILKDDPLTFSSTSEIISEQQLILDNSYYCKEFLNKWRDHIRKLIPHKIFLVKDQYIPYDIDSVQKLIIDHKLKIPTSYSFTYCIIGDSELRVYSSIEKDEIRFYDRCGEYKIIINNMYLIPNNNSDLYYMAYSVLKYERYLHSCDALLKRIGRGY